jgi:hypothetical protein
MPAEPDLPRGSLAKRLPPLKEKVRGRARVDGAPQSRASPVKHKRDPTMPETAIASTSQASGVHQLGEDGWGAASKVRRHERSIGPVAG